MEASIQHHTPSPDLEPEGEEEERPASQQLEARLWSRAEKARDQLVRNDKSSPEQSAMASSRWWLVTMMLTVSVSNLDVESTDLQQE